MNDPVSRAVVRHDGRRRCARALITFTWTDEAGNVRCVSCGKVLTVVVPPKYSGTTTV